MEGSKGESVFNSLNLNPQLFINEALNTVDDLVDDAFDFYQSQASATLKTEGSDRSQDLTLVREYRKSERWSNWVWISDWPCGKSTVLITVFQCLKVLLLLRP
uniref:Uncharacterized protein n=1 Tax=Cucumis melo TaxID=3656 RepID=A0A9I9E4E0_CUCME